MLEFEERLGSGLEGIIEMFTFLETASEVEASGVESRSSVADAFTAFVQVFSNSLQELFGC